MPLHPKVSCSTTFFKREGPAALCGLSNYDTLPASCRRPPLLKVLSSQAAVLATDAPETFRLPGFHRPSLWCVVAPGLAFCQTLGVAWGVTSRSSIPGFALQGLRGAGTPGLRYTSSSFGELKSSSGRNCYLKVISLCLPGRNQPAEIPAGRRSGGKNVMFKSILLPACEKFSGTRCRAAIGGCRRSAFKWHSLTPVARVTSDSVTGCGFFPQQPVILKHLCVFDTFFNEKVMTTSNFLWRYEEQEVVGCYLKYCLSPEQARCEIKSTNWMQTWSASSLTRVSELRY